MRGETAKKEVSARHRRETEKAASRASAAGYQALDDARIIVGRARRAVRRSRSAARYTEFLRGDRPTDFGTIYRSSAQAAFS